MVESTGVPPSFISSRSSFFLLFHSDSHPQKRVPNGVEAGGGGLPFLSFAQSGTEEHSKRDRKKERKRRVRSFFGFSVKPNPLFLLLFFSVSPFVSNFEEHKSARGKEKRRRGEKFSFFENWRKEIDSFFCGGGWGKERRAGSDLSLIQFYFFPLLLLPWEQHIYFL